MPFCAGDVPKSTASTRPPGFSTLRISLAHWLRSLPGQSRRRPCSPSYPPWQSSPARRRPRTPYPSVRPVAWPRSQGCRFRSPHPGLAHRVTNVRDEGAFLEKHFPYRMSVTRAVDRIVQPRQGRGRLYRVFPLYSSTYSPCAAVCWAWVHFTISPPMFRAQSYEYGHLFGIKPKLEP